MANNNKQYEKIKNDTILVKDKIEEKTLLTESECLGLIKEIGSLPDTEIIPKGKGGNTLNIDELLNEFNKCAENSKHHLEKMLSIIADGKIPSLEDKQEFDQALDSLSSIYESACGIAKKELPSDELPEEGSSIHNYLDAIKNSKTALLKNQLIEIKALLEKYISVKSKVAKLTDALESFQKDAEELLNRINEGKVNSVEEISEEYAGPQLFLRALECEDLSTEEGSDMLDSLEENFSYPSRVTRGLLSKSYYIAEKANEGELPSNPVKETVKEPPVPAAETKKEEIPPKEEPKEELKEEPKTENINKPDKKTEETKKEDTKNVPNQPEPENSQSESVKEISAFEKSLSEAQIAKELDDFGILSSSISPAESKKISSSVFSGDVRKGNTKAIKNIIQQLDRSTVVTPNVLNIVYSMPYDVAEVSLEYLYKKGYLKKYSPVLGIEFYCPSERLAKALSYREASKLVEVKQNRFVINTSPIEDRSSSAIARTAFLKLYMNNLRNYRESRIKEYTTDSIILTESFILRSNAKDQKISELFVGAFWTEYKDCDELLKSLLDLLRTNQEISTFVVAAMDNDTACKLTDILLQYLPEQVKEASVYTYDLLDDIYFEYPKKQEIPYTNIWKALAEKTEAETESEPTAKEEEKNEDEDSARVEEEKAEKLPEIETPKVEEPKVVLSPAPIPSTPEKEPKSKEEKEKEIYHLLAEKKFYCATAYAKAISNKDASFGVLYNLIAYSLNDPMEHCLYSADTVFDMVQNVNNDFTESLMIAIGLRTFFSNQVRYDYNIKGFYEAIKPYSVISDHTSLSNVLYKLMNFKDEQNKGMDLYADYHAKSLAQLDDELRKVQHEALLFYESTIAGKKSEKAKQRRFLETKKMLFSVDGDIGQYIKIITDNEKEMQPFMVEFLQETFIKEGSTLSEDNIDSDMLWKYITVFWDKAGDKMMYSFRSDLVSHLRSNIINVTTKALQIMIRWCNLIEKANNQAEDDGKLAYKKIRKALLTDIQESLDSFASDLSNISELDKKAGFEVICATLDEIKRCIDGSYDESEKKFFYAPFLRRDYVLLDDNFCPELDVKSLDVEALQPEYRILEHSKEEPMEYLARLKEILNDGGDDYGSARLIIEYLRATSPDIIVDGYQENVDGGEGYVKETAELKKIQFIGDLELAYVSGQIDNSNSAENKKEKILQVVDSWYEWACDSSNYGFFAKVMDGYLDEIRKSSKTREKDLNAQLNAFKETAISGLSTEAKEKKIKKIISAINSQNYTVAEDLLAHATQEDDDYEDIIEEQFLKQFLEDYNDYYQPVSKSQSSFAMLISNRTRNKEERGGKRLADNWLPGGTNIGKNRLVSLLLGFGFHVSTDTVVQQLPIGRFENYLVKTIPAMGGKRENYTHPIAAFGSNASQEGFRVVCINGKYDAAGLIDIMKQIGNAKNTMILLDCALDKPERRALARKSKLELGDKLFVVIDRTVMMYMVRNYDETKANRMLMSLIVPFGYYQPYVWESSLVMPPEIFMGRKIELESIESPTGANIVYGGRQLGKSALLKKAKADIDKNENGDRVVLVDIKHLGYEAAAKKIGHALYDEGVLTQDINTTDWEELSRAIRKRLQSEKNRIPYLLLLLDESDAFIESCESINYRPFDALKEIQNIGTGRFKFVIAGLRNIVRFKRDAALGNNSVLTHLESMTVKPFKTNEARELMEIPLHYLGLEFPKENESLITLILASTNYFPGLIQMYCAKLLSAMRNKDYAGYDEADTPIYEISEEHIKKVLADSEFTEQIKEKFIITLKLDEDNYYYLIALIMAYMYHHNGYNEGYSALDIRQTGKDLDLKKISSLDEDKLSAFMEELKELNVLRKTDDKHYLFTRFSFFQMMGTSSEVDDKIVEYMEE